MKRNIRLLAALLPLLLSACSLAPEYVRPDTALPDEFALAEEANSATLEAAQTPAEALTAYSAENREWWLNFNSAALPRLQTLALENNHNFAAERWVLAQAFSQARAARSSLLPSIDLGGSTSRRGSDSTSGYRVSDTFGGTVQASYEVDLWGANRESVNAQDFMAEASLYAWRGAGLSLESEVALTYFSLLAARENLSVYERMLAGAREVLDYQEKRERLGAAAPLEVARQRGSVQSMEAERLGYLSSLHEARNSLCLLLGVTELPQELEALIAQDGLMEILPPEIGAGLPAQLLARRPDVAQAEARLMAANADIGVARAAFLPGISLSAQAGWSSDALEALISPASALYSLGASLIAPIFDGGRLMAQYDQSLAAKEELVERYRQSALSAFWEVSTSLTANGLLREQEVSRRESAAQTAEAYRIARTRYAAGAEDYISVIDAQDAMLSADNSLIRARLERLNGSVALFKALGGGWSGESSASF
ncbi:MAG: efflux transporter outer membrane subunit [Deltaproteobacteria bacterium]|jgi:NodT family efflux transporter outer membrane factor (OMF) lipoprotein|nr:efflux transporter outer membrane subunit [Deltaproteobacteria bacterium]